MKISFFYKLCLMIFIILTLSFISYFSNKLHYVEHFSATKNVINDGGTYEIYESGTYIITNDASLQDNVQDNVQDNIYYIYINSSKILNENQFINIADNKTNITIYAENYTLINKTRIRCAPGFKGLIKVGRGCTDITIRNIDISMYSSDSANPLLAENQGALIQKESFVSSSYVEISNCHFKGNVNLSGGGICGSGCFLYSVNTLIKNCSFEGNIAEDGGGIVGENFGIEIEGYCNINNCFAKINTYNPSNISKKTGGIIGSNSGTPMILDNDNDNYQINVSDCVCEGILGNESGGICGPSYKRLVINRCHFKGELTANNEESGGICGPNSDGKSKILNCFADFKNNNGPTPFGLTKGGGICGFKTGSYEVTANCNDEAAIDTCRERYLVEIENCMVKGNLGLISQAAISDTKGGGICGSYSGTHFGKVIIKNCCFIGTINRGGGIIGDNCAGNDGHVEIHNSFSFSDIPANQGGICGQNAGTPNSKLIIKNCLIKSTTDTIQNNYEAYKSAKLLATPGCVGSCNSEFLTGSENNFGISGSLDFYDKALDTIATGDSYWFRRKDYIWTNLVCDIDLSGNYIVSSNQNILTENPSGVIDNKKIIILPNRKLLNLNYIEIFADNVSVEGDESISKDSPIEVEDNWRGFIKSYSDYFVKGKDNISIKNIHIKSLDDIGEPGNLIYGNGGICHKHFGNNCEKTKIINCGFVGNIKNESGGIIGFNSICVNTEFLIKNCYSDGRIENHSGGIISAYCGFESTGVVEECYSLGDIVDSSGGITGTYTFVVLEWLNKYNVSVMIKKCHSKGIINMYSGGILGMGNGVNFYNEQKTANLTLLECFSEGNIDNFSGGITGYFTLFTSLKSCYSLGNIGVNSGGISLGIITLIIPLCSYREKLKEQINCVIENCFSKGNIGTNAGGICGPEGISNIKSQISTQINTQQINLIDEYKDYLEIKNCLYKNNSNVAVSDPVNNKMIGINCKISENSSNNFMFSDLNVFKNMADLSIKTGLSDTWKECNGSHWLLEWQTEECASSGSVVDRLREAEARVSEAETSFEEAREELEAVAQDDKVGRAAAVAAVAEARTALVEARSELDAAQEAFDAARSSGEQHSDANLCQSKCNLQRNFSGEHRSLKLLCDCKECCKTSSENICDDMADYFAQYNCATHQVN